MIIQKRRHTHIKALYIYTQVLMIAAGFMKKYAIFSKATTQKRQRFDYIKKNVLVRARLCFKVQITKLVEISFDCRKR